MSESVGAEEPPLASYEKLAFHLAGIKDEIRKLSAIVYLDPDDKCMLKPLLEEESHNDWLVRKAVESMKLDKRQARILSVLLLCIASSEAREIEQADDGDVSAFANDTSPDNPASSNTPKTPNPSQAGPSLVTNTTVYYPKKPSFKELKHSFEKARAMLDHTTAEKKSFTHF
ncbi:MAG: hypothetical protein MMC33_008415 [Icmadophila ericetorum]|nr:hypothetical protein [Icmadophila ericetorum]